MPSRLLNPIRKIRRGSVARGQLTSLVNSMADGVLAVDSHLTITIVNGAALNILDVNNSLVGKSLNKYINLQDRNNQPVDIEKLILSVKTPMTNRDMLLHYADGSAINLYISIAPVHLGYGKKGKHGYVVLLRDITHEKSLEEERDEFISVVSHELRTPIAITEGNISNAQFIVEKSKDIGLIKDALRQAHDQIMFLASMVNDLATLSRAERGKLQANVEAIDVKLLLDDLQKLYAPETTAKGLKIVTECNLSKPILYSSALYVREILQNFITNAIKYTDHGQITITAKNTNDGVTFAVSDTGIGVGKGDQEKIFDKFFRSEDFRTRKTSGTGLGLYVTVKLAQLIHAEIDMQSQIDKGSTFYVTVPNLQ